MVSLISKSSPPVKKLHAERERAEHLVSVLRQDPRVDPAAIQVVRAPLRVCPLGAHIDHQLGNVTGMTIDQALLMAFAPARNGEVDITSLNFSPGVQFRLAAVPPYQRGDWGNYVRGAVLALQQEHSLQQGLIGVVEGEMPVGGLSSSAAVTVAYLLALEAVNHINAQPAENVSLVRYTENTYIGLKNGILDQSVILYSQPQHLTHIDCQSVTVESVPLAEQHQPFDILVVYSGVAKGLVGTEYNNRVLECQQATEQLLGYAGQDVPDTPRLRHVDPAIFEAEGHHLPEKLYRRAKHYFGEMARVADGVTAWKQGNLGRLGELISASGESSIKYYESGSPQLITLYEILRDTPGVYGTRFSGAGFRGCCIALVDPEAHQGIAEAIHARYPVAHPAEADIYSIHFCRPDGPAGLYPLS